MELRVWVLDPENGMGNVRGEVYLKLWDALRANDIELPFPQRDLHIRSVTVEHNAEIEQPRAMPY
jgi:small-conductance mechanosensitive channel